VGLSLGNTFGWLGNFILPDIGSYPKWMPDEYNFRVVVRQNDRMNTKEEITNRRDYQPGRFKNIFKMS
jgi:hypothetical protein